MKRRAKVLLWAGGVVLVLLVVVGALIARPPVPFAFMHGARFDGVNIIEFPVVGSRISPTGSTAIRRYRTARSFSDVVDAASDEFSGSKEWVGPMSFSGGHNESLLFKITPAGTAGSFPIPETISIRADGEETIIEVSGPVGTLDRVLAKVWSTER